MAGENKPGQTMVISEKKQIQNEKKELQKQQKQQRKEAKKRAREIAKREDALAEGGSGGFATDSRPRASRTGTDETARLAL